MAQKNPLYTSLWIWNNAILLCVCVSTVCVCVYKPRTKWDNNTVTPGGKVIKL